MRVEKKQIEKEDGRYLVYYHFPGAASPEQTEAFEAVDAPVQEVVTGSEATAKQVNAPPPAPQEEKAGV